MHDLSTPSSEVSQADLETRLRRAESGLESSTSTSSSSDLSIESETNPETYTVLRVESITASSLKVICPFVLEPASKGDEFTNGQHFLQKYMIAHFFLEHISQGVWAAAFVMVFRPRTSYKNPLLITSTVLATVCGSVVFAFLFSYVYAIFRAARANQTW